MSNNILFFTYFIISNTFQVDNALYAIGGYNGVAIDTIEKLVNNKWTTLEQKMTSGRYHHCSVEYGNELVKYFKL